MGLVSVGLRSSGLLGGGDWGGEVVVEVETPGSMALSVESCVWCSVCIGAVRVGEEEAAGGGLVGVSDGVGAVVVDQLESVLDLLLLETGGM